MITAPFLNSFLELVDEYLEIRIQRRAVIEQLYNIEFALSGLDFMGVRRRFTQTSRHLTLG